MGRFRLNEPSWIDGHLYSANAVVTVGHDHMPAPHWLPLDDDARQMMADAQQNYTGIAPGPYATIEQQLREALKAAGGRSGNVAPLIANAVVQALGPACEILAVPREKRAPLASAVAGAIREVLG